MQKHKKEVHRRIKIIKFSCGLFLCLKISENRTEFRKNSGIESRKRDSEYEKMES